MYITTQKKLKRPRRTCFGCLFSEDYPLNGAQPLAEKVPRRFPKKPHWFFDEAQLSLGGRSEGRPAGRPCEERPDGKINAEKLVLSEEHFSAFLADEGARAALDRAARVCKDSKRGLSPTSSMMSLGSSGSGSRPNHDVSELASIATPDTSNAPGACQSAPTRPPTVCHPVNGTMNTLSNPGWSQNYEKIDKTTLVAAALKRTSQPAEMYFSPTVSRDP